MIFISVVETFFIFPLYFCLHIKHSSRKPKKPLQVSHTWPNWLSRDRARYFFLTGVRNPPKCTDEKKSVGLWVNKKIFKVFIIVICVMKTSCDATVKNDFFAKTKQYIDGANRFILCLNKMVWLVKLDLTHSLRTWEKNARQSNKNKFFCVRGSNTLPTTLKCFSPLPPSLSSSYLLPFDSR